MTRDEFNAFCASLPATNHVVQWGNADVWKVGPKLFAVGGWADGADAFTFKVSDIAWEILPDMPGLRPAPYLASRGMKWIQHYKPPGLSDAELEAHIRASYDMVAAKLTKKARAELGI
ncbi:Predicted DNA-binding protein, MmcQ/YjbR family [Litoreibacter ascidiaceicola]|uniref:Predicted DNA-binding protein, MmcQ/YjbR family n=1 Tax=Litoreibacter ascidiaceicola TaxID=1486859 RepID=A0A1M4TXY1_9RHOB|nr:MmcQ/YjbR family DNA-binding protein [Litoreibacter ascidiaceicola]SHE49315.1 Predicted DNA-binding protein, MmcQ/YjbR family [Litoreibacter ascidiaceicola]